SIQNGTPEVPIEVKAKSALSAGLQWNLQLPVSGVDNYFKGSTASSQPYRMLLPGAWISIRSTKHILRAEVNPFFDNLLPNKSYGSFINSKNIPDTVITTTEIKSLRKTFGVALTADYDHN